MGFLIKPPVVLAYIKGYVRGRYGKNIDEWLWVGGNGDRIKWSCCKCGRGVEHQENFCPQCGRRMKVERGNYTCE